MINLKLYGAIALVAVAALGSGYGLWARSEVKELRTLNSALENRVAGLLASEAALRKSAETSAAARKRAEEKAASNQRRLDEALRNAPEWADVPVPDGVWGALKR